MKLKVAHIVRETAHGPLSFSDMTSGGRGVTGSEQAMLYLARAQAALGHDVTCYLPTENPGYQEGVNLLNVNLAWPRLRHLDRADVVISWLTADPLRNANPNSLRIHSLQINDWMLCAYGYAQWVDAYVTCSQAHALHLWREAGNPGPTVTVGVLPNGVDIGRFSFSPQRQARKCVYLSSPDRGLHWLLAMWPEIRFAFPDAELHVYYEIQKWLDNAFLTNSEVGMRARYVMQRVNQLVRHGVVLHGAIHPTKLAEELSTASLMLYPCDTIRFTEGFSVATLDACASGVVPIITDADALGEIYGESGAVVIPRESGSAWTDVYLEKVLDLMQNEADLGKRRSRVREFAKKYDWTVIAKEWNDFITIELEKKKAEGTL